MTIQPGKYALWAAILIATLVPNVGYRSLPQGAWLNLLIGGLLIVYFWDYNRRTGLQRLTPTLALSIAVPSVYLFTISAMSLSKVLWINLVSLMLAIPFFLFLYQWDKSRKNL